MMKITLFVLLSLVALALGPRPGECMTCRGRCFDSSVCLPGCACIQGQCMSFN